MFLLKACNMDYSGLVWLQRGSSGPYRCLCVAFVTVLHGKLIFLSSQSALNMVSRCMAVDLEADRILCMVIHPGWVRTDMGGDQVRV